MKYWPLVATLLFAALAFVVLNTFFQPGASNAVTLRAAPGNNIVQMFDSGSVDAEVIATFDNGTRCTKFGGPTSSNIEGARVDFYRLTCHDVTGYVNTKWVH